MAGEREFTSTPASEGVLADLERTTEHVRWSNEPTDSATQYVLFSRSGYTDDSWNRAAARDDVPYDLADVVSASAT